MALHPMTESGALNVTVSTEKGLLTEITLAAGREHTDTNVIYTTKEGPGHPTARFNIKVCRGLSDAAVAGLRLRARTLIKALPV